MTGGLRLRHRERLEQLRAVVEQAHVRERRDGVGDHRGLQLAVLKHPDRGARAVCMSATPLMPGMT